MKGEPKKRKKTVNHRWIIDESKCLSSNETKKLRNYARKEKHLGFDKERFSKVRNWFMVELGLNAGLRVEEMAGLKHGNLLIDDSRSSIVLIGKGKKKRIVLISSTFKKICQAFIKYKTNFNYNTDRDSYLLNNLKGEKISKRSLQKFFKEIVIKSGLPKYYYIHCLRHTYATFLLKASNYNYRFVQQQLGHSSIITTQVYASVVEPDGKKAVEKLFR